MKEKMMLHKESGLPKEKLKRWADEMIKIYGKDQSKFDLDGGYDLDDMDEFYDKTAIDFGEGERVHVPEYSSTVGLNREQEKQRDEEFKLLFDKAIDSIVSIVVFSRNQPLARGALLKLDDDTYALKIFGDSKFDSEIYDIYKIITARSAQFHIEATVKQDEAFAKEYAK